MKKVLLFLLVIAAAGIGIAFYQWNKPHETVEDRQAIRISAEDLSHAFISNEEAANKKYLDQVIEVSGAVSEVISNQDGRKVINLSVSDPLSGVQCTMTDDKVEVVVGKQVSVKGFCNAYTLTVVLSDCVLVR